MRHTNWRAHAGAIFTFEKEPATGSRGMVVNNLPPRGRTLAAGGNAIAAAIAALFTLTVVEPMMVGVLGSGVTHISLANGTHHMLDSLCTAPLATGPTTYTPEPMVR